MGIRFSRLLPALIAPASVLVAQTPLLLRSGRPAAGEQIMEWSYPKRLSAGRSHIILQFRNTPQAPQIAELERRGAKLLRYVPHSAFLAAVRDGTRLETLGAERAVRLEPRDKFSSLLPEAGSGAFVVEFHPDVDRPAAAGLVRDHILTLRSHPDLLPDQLLVEGPARNIRRLAEWDEVAYIFPASRELLKGRRVRACPGAVSVDGPIGQYVAQIGPGWTNGKKVPVQLGWTISSNSVHLPPDELRAAIVKALAEWSRHVQIAFVPAARATADRSVNIEFAIREHGDGFAFDGPGSVLAHTFYPSPPNPEPIAGDIHFDDEEGWGDGELGSLDLFSAALHEAGHALGLGHSDNPDAVMYPYYRRVTALTQEDIEAIREMYAAREQTPADPDHPSDGKLQIEIATHKDEPVTTLESSIALSGTVTGGQGAIRVSWSSSTGLSGDGAGERDWTIAAVPLVPGSNEITVTASDSEGETASKSLTVTRVVKPGGPVLTITYPGESQTLTEATVVIAGTVSSTAGLAAVVWSNSRGGAGTATGTSRWTAGPIPLQEGLNVITIAAVGAWDTVEKWVEVTYSPPEARRDTTAPSVRIDYPGLKTLLTFAGVIRIRGASSDDTGVTSVTWEDSLGNGGTAAGTDYWDTGAIALREGANPITIRAHDAAGNTGWKSVVITRRVR